MNRSTISDAPSLQTQTDSKSPPRLRINSVARSKSSRHQGPLDASRSGAGPGHGGQWGAGGPSTAAAPTVAGHRHHTPPSPPTQPQPSLPLLQPPPLPGDRCYCNATAQGPPACADT